MPQVYRCIEWLYQNIMVILPFAKFVSPVILTWKNIQCSSWSLEMNMYFSQEILENNLSLRNKPGKTFLECGGHPVVWDSMIEKFLSISNSFTTKQFQRVKNPVSKYQKILIRLEKIRRYGLPKDIRN